MNDKNKCLRHLPVVAALLASGGLLATACIADEPGIDTPDGAGTTSGGSGAQAGSGATTAGTSMETPSGGKGSAGAAQGGKEAGGSSSGGGITLPEAGAGGAPGGEEGGAPPVAEACVFHSDSPMAAGGEGGAGPLPTITLQTSPFVGSYLADGAGRTLYVYGADLPGDCRADNAPKSRCEADCVASWPLFDAGDRVLGPGLVDTGFGSIQRADGFSQTTYFGWPLYYYKTDLLLGQMTGQGKGKTWHVAETTPASVVIMKEGAVKYLANGSGHTLYVSAADKPGNGGSDPVSTCSGACLDTFERFHQSNPSLVPSLEQQDFSVFLASGSQLQLAFKGQPLYLARTDVKAGDTTGTATSGFTAALP